MFFKYEAGHNGGSHNGGKTAASVADVDQCEEARAMGEALVSILSVCRY